MLKKMIEGCVAFCSCLSVKNTVCNYLPFASDGTFLKEGDILRLAMGCYIDSFIALIGHTHVIAAANSAADVALTLVRSGKKSQGNIAEVITRVHPFYWLKMSFLVPLFYPSR